ncbi:MAG: patatin-like phospholipase family protein [Bacteroidales bacterium]|nr:patatin-like phospholipase family protein [Bacteroidales bacterium]
MRSFRTPAKEHQYGLVLSGGAARGYAHVGVLKALNEAGIYPDIISGVSAGAIAGAFYADGHHPDAIIEMFFRNNLYEYIKLSIPRMGIASMTKIRELLRNNLHANTFEELQTPLIVNATDLNHGKTVYFSKGKLLDVVIASSAMPILFNPVKIDGTTYADGGIMNNLPIEPLMNKCETLIAVNVNPLTAKDDFNNLASVAERTFQLGVYAHTSLKKDKPDVYIEPYELHNYGLVQVSKGREIYETGYEAAKSLLKQIKLKPNKVG